MYTSTLCMCNLKSSHTIEHKFGTHIHESGFNMQRSWNGQNVYQTGVGASPACQLRIKLTSLILV